MEDKYYNFKANGCDVDFVRIIQEAEKNEKDFVKVEWRNKKGRNKCCYFATLKGYKRAHRVNLDMYFDRNDYNINASGNLVASREENVPLEYSTYRFTRRNWDKFLSKLRKREDGRLRIYVIQSN